MRFFFLLVAILGCWRPALAASSVIWWPGWSIESSEDISEEQKYHSYPLPLMFDGDPKTAWVYSATSREWDAEEWNGRYGVKLEPARPVTIDGLRIMNGHNLSRSRFYKNNRAVRLRVDMETGGKHIVRVVRLPDTLGWHEVKLPRRSVTSIKIQFLDLKRGPANDLCISELELRNGRRKVNLNMPKAVMFSTGIAGCEVAPLIDWHGKSLAYLGLDMGWEEQWSNDGRYVCGAYGDPGTHWIADARRGEVIGKTRNWQFPNENATRVEIWRNGVWKKIVLS